MRARYDTKNKRVDDSPQQWRKKIETGRQARRISFNLPACHGFSGARENLSTAPPPPLLLLLLLLVLLASLGRFTPLPVSFIRIPKGPPHAATSGAVPTPTATRLASLSSLSCLGSAPHLLVSDTRDMSTVRHSNLSVGHASATPGKGRRESVRWGGSSPVKLVGGGRGLLTHAPTSHLHRRHCTATVVYTAVLLFLRHLLVEARLPDDPLLPM